jgi:RNA polymerase sigma-70 factor (ECF subfamily)
MAGVRQFAVARRQANHPSELSDERLVARILDGNGADFEVLVRRHQGAIYSFILRMVRDPEEAMDLCQEVFLKVFSSLERFDPQFRFTTWLYRIVSNTAIDEIRRRRTGAAFSLDAPAPDDSAPREVAGAEPMPDEMLAARETMGRLEEALKDLPDGYREVLLLRHQGERRYDEIARITGLPIGTVKNRIFRAREMLRRAL